MFVLVLVFTGIYKIRVKSMGWFLFHLSCFILQYDGDT